MKVLHINTNDSGGAAIACIRVHRGLLDKNAESKILFLEKRNNIPYSSTFNVKVSFLRKISDNIKFRLISANLIKREVLDSQYNFIKQRPAGLEMYSFPETPYDIIKTKEYREADIIHLHWVSGFLDWKRFFKKNTKPVVWTLHDHNPFLGGQHYRERYLGIDETGYPINRIISASETLKENELLEFKRQILNDVSNLYVVGNSKWTKTESQKSIVFGKYPHYHIDYGYPINIFKKLDKNCCRDLFGLSREKKIVLFGADSINNQRKGFIYLVRAIELVIAEFNSNNIEFCAFGNNDYSNYPDINFVGPIKDERLMAALYNSADVFVIPSLEEALGMVAVESLLCGTPVIGFPTGGIKETVVDGINGILCEEISVKSLVLALKKVLLDEVKFNGDNISKKAREKYSLSKQADEYLKLYNNIQDKNKKKTVFD